uniref:BSD domain-containing protein n=1 Tax=Spongospora subterranea TaxID=70186 RepID=A0A0H5RPK9_9EUKA|eukprot:CRZ10659.1 hypothetical protein [Spongospora subterranea]
MSTDQILFSCPSVQYKKQSGQLHVAPNRIIFFTESKQLSISRESITDCIGSRSTSLKAQVATASKTYVFVFGDGKSRDAFLSHVNSTTPAASVAVLPETQTKISATVQQEPISFSGTSAEAQIRALLLARDPMLRRAYHEVVEESKLISSAEFWRTREHLLELERHSTQAQRVGLSSAMLAAVQPTTNGASAGVVAYTLSSGAIVEILAKHPAVRRAYEEYVPEQLTEQEFWTKYFQSQYFKRARDHFVGAVAEDSVLNPIHDIFSHFEEQPSEGDSADQSLKPAVTLNRMVDLSLNEREQEEQEGKGILSTRERSRMELIKEFNNHSKIVLSTAGKHTDTSEVITERTCFEANELDLTKSHVSSAPMPVPLRQMDESFRFVKAEAAEIFNDNRVISHGFPPILTQLTHQCRTTDKKSSAKSAFVIFNADQPDERIPDKILEAVKSRTIKATELLRHFWSCFPLTAE